MHSHDSPSVSCSKEASILKQRVNLLTRPVSSPCTDVRGIERRRLMRPWAEAQRLTVWHLMDLRRPWPWPGQAHKLTSWNRIQFQTSLNTWRILSKFPFLLLFSTAQTHKKKTVIGILKPDNHNDGWSLRSPLFWHTFCMRVKVFIWNDTWGFWCILSESSDGTGWNTKAEKISRLQSSQEAPRLCEWREIPGLRGDHRIYFGLIGTVCGVVTLFDNQPQRSQRQYEDRNLGSLQERPLRPPRVMLTLCLVPLCLLLVFLCLFFVRNLTGWNELKWKWGVSRIPRMFLSGKRLQKTLDFWEFPTEMFRLWSSAQSRCLSARRSEEKHQGFLQLKFKHDDTKMDDKDTKAAGHIHLEDGWSPSHTATLNLPHLWNVQ